MIVNQLQNGWEVIFHRAHALLAGRIGYHWSFESTPDWLWDTITAIVQHDDHVLELETPHLTDLGHPEDFRLKDRFCAKIIERHIITALHRSKWVALMTSMHLCFVLAEQADERTDVKNFVRDQKDLQQRWLASLPHSEQDAARAYFFLRFCDRLSLILACRQIPEKGRRLEICGNEETTYFLRQVENRFLTVEPWPFRDSEFSLQLEYRVLAAPGYCDSQELQEALCAAEATTREWKMVRMGS